MKVLQKMQMDKKKSILISEKSFLTNNSQLRGEKKF